MNYTQTLLANGVPDKGHVKIDYTHGLYKKYTDIDTHDRHEFIKLVGSEDLLHHGVAKPGDTITVVKMTHLSYDIIPIAYALVDRIHQYQLNFNCVNNLINTTSERELHNFFAEARQLGKERHRIDRELHELTVKAFGYAWPRDDGGDGGGNGGN
jgi:hypothetical protein